MTFKERMMLICQTFKYKCLELGWVYDASGTLLTITKHINPDSDEEYEQALSEYKEILDLYPSTTRNCSVWLSTDKTEVKQYGIVRAHKSGGSKPVLKALNTI